MEPRKLVRSTRDYKEHLQNIMAYQELKSTGMSDKKIANQLQIGISTLQQYKKTLAEINLESLSSEYIVEKKLEVDNQIEAILGKLYLVIKTIEEQHEDIANDIKAAVQDIEEDDPKYTEKVIRLKRLANYPSKDVAEIAKLALEAIKLRTVLWNDVDHGGDTSVMKPKKVVVNVSAPTQDIDRLNSIADAMISNK